MPAPAISLALIGAALLWAPSGDAAEADGYLTLSSGYVFRGVELSDRPTALLGAEQVSDGGWVLGAWGVGVQSGWPFGAVEQDVQIGAYAGRDFECGSHCRARLSISRYVHPGSSAPGWSELSFGVRYRERLGGSMALGRNDAPFHVESRNFELFYEQPLAARWSTGLVLGHSDYAGFRYDYGELDLRRPLGRHWLIEFGARYSAIRAPEGATRHQRQLLVSLARGF